MLVKNVPKDKPEGEEVTAGPKAFEDLFASTNAGAGPNSVAMAWFTTHKDVGWPDAWAITKKAAEDEVGTAAHVKTLMGSYADSVAPRYFLVCVGKKVDVLYGWRVCRPMDEEGRVYAGLIGDRVGRSGGGRRPLLSCSQWTKPTSTSTVVLPV